MSERDRCKVGSLIERYDIDVRDDDYDDVDDYLLAAWTGEAGGEEMGYRRLTEWFHRRVLKSVYDEHGRSTLGARLADEYETLTGEDDLAREELLDDLARDGIDGDALAAEMVSWSTMRRHLVDCLGGEKEVRTAESDWERESVRIATDQLTRKVDDALSSYETKGEIAGATEATVSVDVLLSCPHCPTRRSLSDARRLGYVCEDHLGTPE